MGVAQGLVSVRACAICMHLTTSSDVVVWVEAPHTLGLTDAVLTMPYLPGSSPHYNLAPSEGVLTETPVRIRSAAVPARQTASDKQPQQINGVRSWCHSVIT